MRIGFVDCSANKLDAYEIVVQALESKTSDVSISRETAPGLLKVPVAVKRLFNEGVDSCLVFLTASSEETTSIDLLHEKLIDVEVSSAKYAFLCIVFDDEWHTPSQMEEVIVRKLAQAIEEVVKMTRAPAVAPEQPPASGMEVFDAGAPPEPDEAMATGERAGQGSGRRDDDGMHRLF